MRIASAKYVPNRQLPASICAIPSSFDCKGNKKNGMPQPRLHEGQNDRPVTRYIGLVPVREFPLSTGSSPGMVSQLTITV